MFIAIAQHFTKAFLTYCYEQLVAAKVKQYISLSSFSVAHYIRDSEKIYQWYALK